MTELTLEGNLKKAKADQGHTALWDSLHKVFAQVVVFTRPDCEYHLLVLTDGEDNASTNASLETIRADVKANKHVNFSMIGTGLSPSTEAALRCA